MLHPRVIMPTQPQGVVQVKESSLWQREWFALPKLSRPAWKMALENLNARSVVCYLKTMDVQEMRLFLRHPKLSQFVLPREKPQILTAMLNFTVFWPALVTQQTMIHVAQLQMHTVLLVQFASAVSSATVDEGCVHFHWLP